MKIHLHRSLITFLVLGLSLVVVAACYPPTDLLTNTPGGTSTGTGGSSMNTIEGNWQLVSVGGAPAIAGSEATMWLAGGRVSGTSGCNHYNGSYTLSGANGIKFGALAMTEMACPGLIMAQEQAFTQALAAAASYSVSQDHLAFHDAAGAELATFRPRESTALLGTTWVASGINNGRQAVQSIVSGTEVTARFGTDGTLSGTAGCNQYSAQYTVDGSRMTITAPVSTRMFCGEPAGVMEQEQAYLTALEKVATYSIDGDRLQLRSSDGSLQVDYRVKP